MRRYVFIGQFGEKFLGATGSASIWCSGTVRTGKASDTQRLTSNVPETNPRSRFGGPFRCRATFSRNEPENTRTVRCFRSAPQSGLLPRQKVAGGRMRVLPLWPRDHDDHSQLERPSPDPPRRTGLSRGRGKEQPPNGKPTPVENTIRATVPWPCQHPETNPRTYVRRADRQRAQGQRIEYRFPETNPTTQSRRVFRLAKHHVIRVPGVRFLTQRPNPQTRSNRRDSSRDETVSPTDGAMAYHQPRSRSMDRETGTRTSVLVSYDFSRPVTPVRHPATRIL